MSEYLARGGPGAFVWSAYAVTALIIAGLLVWSWMGLKAVERQEAELGRRTRRRSERRSQS